MTLPTVVNNARNKQLEAGLKRSYSLIAQALDRYQAETGERLTNKNVSTHQLKSMIMKYFEVAQDCGMGFVSATLNTKGCVTNNVTSGVQGPKTYKTYNGLADMYFGYFNDGQFVLKDGSLILIENGNDVGKILFISVDVNGFNKNPNRLGQDLFMFQIDDKGKLLPMGVNGTTYYQLWSCYKNSTNPLNGAGCTYKALNEKDYFKNLPK